MAEAEIIVAHISDLHHPHCKDETWDRLAEYLRTKNPVLIVVTGDLTDHPWLWRQFQVKRRLVALAQESGDPNAPAPQLLIIPGNHDFAFWGNLNFGGVILRSCFGWCFREYWTDFYEVSKDGVRILFFCFDSNPLIARFAKGVVSKRQLRRFERKVTELKKQDMGAYDSAFKVAILHHHPLPIPYAETAEKFLVLKNAGEFLRFAAQAGMNLLLHGHKHHAVVSSINLGTVSSGKRKIAVVASGSTLRRSDAGNSMNLLRFRKGLPIAVTPVLAAPGSGFIEKDPVTIPGWTEYIEDCHQILRGQKGYKIESVTRTVAIDEQGDGYTRVFFRNFVAYPQHFAGIEPFEIFVRAGSIEDFQIDAAVQIKKLMTVERIPEERTQHIKIHISKEIAEHSPVDFGFNYWTLNAWALSAEEYGRKYTQTVQDQKNDVPHETVFLESSKPVDQFNFEIYLPNNCKLEERPELQIKVSGSSHLEKELQDSLSRGLSFSEEKKVIFFNVEKPLDGFRYDVRWNLAAHSAKPNLKYSNEIAKASEDLIQCAGAAPQILAEVMSQLENAVRRKLTAHPLSLKIPVAEQIDVSFSVPVYKTGQPALLKVIAANLNIPDIMNFSIAIGDGTGGRAFKTNRTQSYFEGRVTAGDPKKNIYVRLGDYIHKVLYSSPVRHPLSAELLLGVFSIGSRDQNSGLIPAKLNEQVEEKISQAIYEVAQSLVLGALDGVFRDVISITEV